MFHDALAQILRSPALIGVLFIEFVFLFFLGVVVSIIPVSSFGVAAAILAIQFAVSVVAHALVSAGFSNMMRNAVQDGSTTIREFMPGVRRYWTRFIGYHVVRSLAIGILLVPFIVATASSPGMHYAPLSLFIAGGALVAFFWLLWTAPIIVFDDVQTLDAIKGSIAYTHKDVWRTLRTLLACAGVMVAAMLLSMLAGLPYAALVSDVPQGAQPPGGVIAMGAALDVAQFLLFALATVVCIAYVFQTYGRRSTPAARKTRRKAPASPA